jgi:hypothetical protein
MPDAVTGLVICLVIYAAVRPAIAQHPVQARDAGRHATIAAGVAFALSMAAFTLWYLPIHSPLLAGLAGVACFIVINIVGFLATGSVAGHHGEGSSRQGAKTL